MYTEKIKYPLYMRDSGDFDNINFCLSKIFNIDDGGGGGGGGVHISPRLET